MKISFLLFSLLFLQLGFGQIVEMPEMTKVELLRNSFDLDSTANAIVLLEKGNTIIQKSESDRVLMVFHRYGIRVKVLNQEGYEHANYSVPTYTYGTSKEYVVDIKANTYNIAQDGAITKTTLKMKDIFTEQVSEYLNVTKFTLPDVQPGSVIDVEYTIISPDIFKFRTWTFLSDIPKLWQNMS